MHIWVAVAVETVLLGLPLQESSRMGPCSRYPSADLHGMPLHYMIILRPAEDCKPRIQQGRAEASASASAQNQLFASLLCMSDAPA